MAIIRRAASSLAFVFSLSLTSLTASAVDLDSAHLAVPGDFNADGRLDVLLQPLTRADKGALVLQDGTGNLSVVAQGWDPGYLGLDWSAGASTLSTADLNGDGQDDVIVQPRKSGQTAAVLIADPSVQFLAVNQLLPKGYLGLDWSSAANSLVAGDFDGDHHKELFLQSMKRSGTGALVHADAEGHLIAIYQSFPDRYLGRHWSAADETFYVGDFNGDGRQDLLVQSQGRAGESAYALLLADGNGRFTRLNETWNLKDLGADWDPATHAIVVEDANGDGIMDITLRSKTGGTNYLFEGSAQNNFGKPAVQWTGTKSAADALADKDSKSGTKSGTGTKTGISVGIGSGGPTAHTITGGTDPEQTATTTRSGQGVSGSGSIMTVNAVGALKGSGGVSGGTATYSIPIALPPGIAGMQPSVSLNYSSRGGNGEMGMGWSLGAGSQIHRCPATRAMDNYPSGVSYGNNDRLCLDGQHLVLVSGTYGYVNAVYRTERDSFARITQSGGGFGSTSSYFTVEQADGHTSIYGNTTDSVFVAGGQSAPLAWGLNRVKDRFSNTINYHYTAYGTGEYLLTSIDYTGTGSTAGNREVDFNYQTRNDGGNQYLAGGLTQQTQLLSSIVTKVNGTQVTAYNTEYSNSSATGRSLLAGVQQCGGSGSSKLCLAETTFSWHAPSTGFDSPAAFDADSFCDDGDADQYTGHLTYDFSSPGDLNGDGRKDLIMFRDGCGARAYFALPGGGYDTPVAVTTDGDDGSLFTNYLPTQSAFDLDGDGVAELVGQYPNPNSTDAVAHPYLWGYSKYVPGTTPSFAAPVPLPSLPEDDYLVGMQDVDGDGKVDILAVEVDPDTTNYPNYHRFVAYLNTTPPCTSCSGRTLSFSSTATFIYRTADVTDSGGTRWLAINALGDINGDGLPDFSVTNTAAMGSDIGPWIYPQVSSSNALSFTTATETPPNGGYTLDINGDGLPDKAYKCASNGHWCYVLNTGEIGSLYGSEVDTGVSDSLDGGAPEVLAGLLVADLDGDGTQELVFPDVLKSDYCVQELNSSHEFVNHCFHGGGDGPDLLPSQDMSIYQYRRIKFAWGQDSGGVWKYLPQGAATGIIAQNHTAAAFDVDGDGLTDVVSSFNKLNLTDSFDDVSGFTRPHGPHYVTNASGSSTSLNAAPDLMLTATDGYGVQSKWNYYPLSSSKSYNSAPLYQAPTLDDADRYKEVGYFYFDSSMYVVGDYSLSDGIGGMREHDFHYGPAIYNSQGRGFQGFRTVVDDDEGSGARTVQLYYQHFPLSGMLRKSWVTTLTPPSGYTLDLVAPDDSDANIIEHTANTWGCLTGASYSVDGVTCSAILDASTFVPAVQETVEKKYDVVSHALLSTSTTDYCAVSSGACTGAGYDLYGNSLGSVTSLVEADGSTFTSSTSLGYDTPDTTNWWLNKLMSKVTTVQATYAGLSPQPTVTRETDYDYNGDGTRGLNHLYARQDNAAANLVTTHYVYDRGNVTSVTVSGGSGGTAITSRTTTTTYTTGTDDHYFVASVTDALGFVTYTTPDPRFGSPAEVITPDGVETDAAYDVFGRKTSTQVVSPASLPAQTVQYLPASGTSLCNGTQVTSQYYVLVNQTGHPGSYTCYDMLGRTVRSAAEGFTTGTDHVYVDTDYNSRGQAYRSTEPYFASVTSPTWDTDTYFSNMLHRLHTHTVRGVVTTYTYSGFVTTVATDDSSATRTDVETRNSLGKMLNVVNVSGVSGQQATTTYTYDSDGNPLTVTDDASNTITSQYNILGQKTQVADPDQGTTTFSYDVLGELLGQTDAKSQTQSFVYDVGGRMLSKHSDATGEGYTYWCYDGMVYSSTSSACTGSAVTGAAGKQTSVYQVAGNYQQDTGYDTLGRANHTRDIIDDGAGHINSYDTDTTYDSYGRVDTVTYPTSIPDAAPVANAGANQYVLPGATVTLSASATDSDGGPLGLKYQWDQTAGPTATLSSDAVASPTFTATSTLGTTYTFQVTADDGLTSDPDSVNVTVPNGPATVTGLSDDGDSDHDGSYAVSWSAVAGVTGTTMKYHLEEAFSDTNSAPSSGSYSEIACNGVSGGTTATSCTVSHTGNSHYYYWYRVRAENFIGSGSVGVGSYSSVDSIHLVVTPGEPSSISPTTGTTTTGTFYISWGAYTGSVVSSKVFYELQEDTALGFTSPSTVYSGTLRYKSITKTALDDYYYRVRACNQDGSLKECSDWRARAHIIVNGSTNGGCDVNCQVQLRYDDREGATTGLDRFASVLSHPEVPTSVREKGGDETRPVFDKPVYLAYADARIERATVTAPLARFAVQYVYTDNGHLWQLTDAVNPNRIFWQVDEQTGSDQSGAQLYKNGMDARGNVTKSIYGSGTTAVNTHFTYDAATGFLRNIDSVSGSTTYQALAYTWTNAGNLLTRQATVSGVNLTETFTYDKHNRVLTSIVQNASGTQPTVTYAYDTVGNITQRTDGSTTTGYTYGYGGSHPHAVSQLAVGSTVTGSYAYDADGNMACRDVASTNCTGSSPTANIVWNSDGLPTTIGPSSGDHSDFAYGPDKHRYKQVAKSGSTTTTTYYVSGLEIVTDSSGTKYRHNLSAYGRPVYIATTYTDGSGNPAFDKNMVLTDHLGSVDMVVTNATTPTVDRESFDVFGKRRSATDWHSSGSSIIETQHGFTGHEHLDNMGLVHMNGRVMDPAIGRFLSVDPVYQAPTNSQSVNPYSYVMNNPLSLNDPSGYAAEAACSTGSPGSTPSCDPSNSDLKAGDSKTISYTPTGSHVAVTVTATVQADGSVAITSNNAEVAKNVSNNVAALTGSGNGNETGTTGTTTPSVSNAGGSANQGSPAQRPLVTNDGKGNVSLTSAGEQLSIQIAQGLPAATEPNESYKVVGSGGDVSGLQTQGCDNRHCDLDGKTLVVLVRNPVIVVHDHQNDPAGGLANEGRAWPGPGDQNVVLQAQIVNVYKGNDGAVRAIELRDGKPVVRTLTGGNDKFNSFIQRNWQPFRYQGNSMPESAISAKQQGYDDGHP